MRTSPYQGDRITSCKSLTTEGQSRTTMSGPPGVPGVIRECTSKCTDPLQYTLTHAHTVTVLTHEYVKHHIFHPKHSLASSLNHHSFYGGSNSKSGLNSQMPEWLYCQPYEHGDTSNASNLACGQIINLHTKQSGQQLQERGDNPLNCTRARTLKGLQSASKCWFIST